MSALKTYHVKHILLKHLYEADDVLRKLAAGASFTEMAQKFSQCPSAPKGGDLGTLRQGQADEAFEEAALALQVDQQTAKPVRSRFGYHLILRIK